MKKFLLLTLLMAAIDPLTTLADTIITFVDPNVKAICVENWDTNGDGELSEEEAAAVEDLGQVFREDSCIISFDELRYFTGLTSIADYAFENCVGLTSIVFPSGITSIGLRAFRECNSMVTFDIPSSVNYIGANAFGGCNILSSFIIPDGITTISQLFPGCYSMTSVTIPNSVKSISSYSFYYCSSLTSVIIPSNVTEIGSNAFGNCDNLTTVTVGNETPVAISENVFSNRTNATLYVPEGCKATYQTAPYWNEFKEIIEDQIITFADATVKALCVAKWDTNGDGELSQIEAMAVKDLGDTFCGNSTITTFNELQYFTGLTSIGKGSKLSLNEIPFWAHIDEWGLQAPKRNTVAPKWAIGESTDIPYGDPSVNAFADLSEYAKLIVTFSEGVPRILLNRDVDEGQWNEVESQSHLIDNTRAGWSDRYFTTNGNMITVDLKQLVNDKGFAHLHAIKGANWENVTITSMIVVTDDSPASGNNITAEEAMGFSYCSSLSSITIPANVNIIGDYAFLGCSGLSSLTIPNSVTFIGDYAFSGCSGLTSEEIPNSVISIGDYAFNGCSGLTSVSLQEGLTCIGNYVFQNCSGLTSLFIPSSVTIIGNKAFFGCNGITSVVSQITEPFAIDNSCFNIDNSTWTTATLYVPADSKSLYKATDGWKNFSKINSFGGVTITITVTDDRNSDISDKVSIIWKDADGKTIGTGKRLGGIEEDTYLYYSVELNEELGRVYHEVKMQEVKADNIALTCQLEKIGRIKLEGRVSATDIENAVVTVSIKQMLNGKWEQTYTTQANKQGEFSVEVFDDEADITISSEGYFNSTIHRDGFSGNGYIGVIPINLLTGFSIAANITIQNATTVNETTKTTAWTEGLNNIEFAITNITKHQPITDFTVQNGNIIIKTGASIGDKINLTAISKEGLFAESTTMFIIVDGANFFDLQLTELGGINATYATSSNGCTSGYLYDCNNILITKGSYTGETLSLRHLKNGVYTLVTMGNSLLLGSLSNLADLSSVGLREGTDYVATHIVVVDGELTTVSVNEVPRLDETRFYYTTDNTYFNANKASVTAGNYLTLQAKIDFKTEYKDNTNDVTLLIDLPEGCQLVEQSVIANRKAVAHTLNNNRLTIPLNKEQYESQIRFCVIPTQNKTYNLTAMASFNIDGQVQQPIGSTNFEVKGLTLTTPNKAISTNITIYGKAKGHCDVSIYDNEVFIGKTSSKADGTWRTECELYNPYSHSFHDIYAKIITEDGTELTSETQQVEYDKNTIVPEKVTMQYYNLELDINYNIVFDLIKGTTTPSSYFYFPYKEWPTKNGETEPKDFTFLANFTRNDSSLIKNVNIKVLNSDGTVRTLPASFDGKQNCWVATTKYASTNRLPRNVKVEYDYLEPSAIADKDRMLRENKKIDAAIEQYIMTISQSGKRIIKENEEEFVVAYEQAANDSIILGIKVIPHDEINTFVEKAYHYVDDSNDIWLYDTKDGNNDLIYVWNNEIAYRISFSEKSIAKASVSRRKEWWNNWGDLGKGIVRGVNSIPLIGNPDMLRVIDDYNYWEEQYIQYMENHIKYNEHTMNLLVAKCEDGDYKLSKTQIEWYAMYKGFYYDDCNRFEQNMRDKLDRYAKSINQRCWISAGLQATSLVGGWALGAFTKAGGILKAFIETNAVRQIGNFIGTTVATGYVSNITGTLATDSWIGDYLAKYCVEEERKIMQNYISLNDIIKKSYRECPKEDDDDKNDDDDDFNGDGTKENLDPSGYVYEAVLSNRLEGVTTTCYQKVMSEDMYGDLIETAVVWNAEDFSQQNPLKTDKAGFYRWDVPQGMWQVKYEKEGYETAYSDWLPVPPPQLDVNIGMKQSTPPTVKQMRGYESGITIELSKYMRPETMTTEKITVTRNGSAEAGSIELMNAEQAPLGDETYVSKVKFVPENRFNATDLVVVTVHKEVESYCGVQMTADHVETVKIESEVKSIVADSLVTVPYQGEREMRVVVLPKDASAGRTLKVKTSSTMIASVSAEEVTIGQDGAATLTLGGELPGGAILDFSVDGTDVKATSRVKVVMGREMVAKPVANISSGVTISGGTQIELTCETEGATIYYTLDGSCPCDEATRHKYDGPFTIATDVIVKAIAVKDDMDDSDIATFVYIVDGIDGINYNSRFDAIYQDGSVVVTGAKGASCHIYDLQGREVATRLHLSNQATISVPKTEIYVVSVTFDDGQTVVKKVVRKQ